MIGFKRGYMFLVATIFIFGCSRDEVVRVTDADELLVKYRGKTEEVRLTKLEAPDPGQPGNDEAMKFLQGLVTGKRIVLEFETPGQAARDESNRLLAYVMAEGKNVNLEMVRAGVAKVADEGGRLAVEFKRAEAEARAAEKGLWKAPPPPPPPPVEEPAPVVPAPGGTATPAPAPGGTVAPAPGGTATPAPAPGGTVAPAPGGTAAPAPTDVAPAPGGTAAPAPTDVAPAPGGTAAAAPDEEGFCASRDSEIYHPCSCPTVKRIKPENLIRFQTEAEAIASGRGPCNCQAAQPETPPAPAPEAAPEAPATPAGTTASPER